jgi:radical SAM superfamily enzyme YgiQ (UPF0313 family)
MKSEILLYNPPTVYDKRGWAKPLPLNLLSVCSLIDEEKFGINITQKMPNGAYDKFSPFLDKAICLGISCMTGTQILHGLSLAKEVRNANPDIPIIWGGYHPTASPEQTLLNEYVDIVVRGYGEETFSELVELLSKNQDYKRISGISFAENGGVINRPDRPATDLINLPSLPYHLIDLEAFFNESKSRTLHYISSRGCPHRCGFCADYVIYKGRWNPLSAERVISDLEILKEKYGYEFVKFYDSNLFVDEKRIKRICQGVIEKKLQFRWIGCNGDAFLLSKYSSDTFKLMHEAGLSNILLGVESGHEPALECIHKKAGTRENVVASNKLHENSISIGYSFMFGFPYDLPKKKLENEHKKELNATMNTIADLSFNYLEDDYYLLFAFTPYPGVSLYGRYKELGYHPPDSFEAWGLVNLNETKSCPWVSDNSKRMYKQCLKFNWFFMHELERKIFRGKRNTRLRRFAKACDDTARRYLLKRIRKGKLFLPAMLELVWGYYTFRNSVIMRGWKGSIQKVKYALR